MITAVQLVIQLVILYFTNLCEAFDLEQYVPNYMDELPRDLLIIQPQNQGNYGVAQKILNGSIQISKKMFQQLNAFIKTNSENPRVKLLFSRYYPVTDLHCNYQIVVDVLGRIAYRIASKSCELMGLKQSEFVQEYGRSIILVNCRGSYSEFVEKTVEQIVDVVGEWLS